MCIHFVCISRHVWLLARVQELAFCTVLYSTVLSGSSYAAAVDCGSVGVSKAPPSFALSLTLTDFFLATACGVTLCNQAQCSAVVYTSSIHGIMLHEILYEFMLFSLIFAIVYNQTFLWEGPYFSAPGLPHLTRCITTVSLSLPYVKTVDCSTFQYHLCPCTKLLSG